MEIREATSTEIHKTCNKSSIAKYFCILLKYLKFQIHTEFFYTRYQALLYLSESNLETHSKTSQIYDEGFCENINPLVPGVH